MILKNANQYYFNLNSPILLEEPNSSKVLSPAHHMRLLKTFNVTLSS